MVRVCSWTWQPSRAEPTKVSRGAMNKFARLEANVFIFVVWARLMANHLAARLLAGAWIYPSSRLAEFRSMDPLDGALRLQCVWQMRATPIGTSATLAPLPPPPPPPSLVKRTGGGIGVAVSFAPPESTRARRAEHDSLSGHSTRVSAIGEGGERGPHKHNPTGLEAGSSFN